MLQQANNSRVTGWQRCRELIKPLQTPDGKTYSRLHVFRNCTAFIRTIPALVHDDIRVEDVDTHGEDHHADQFRYAVNTAEGFGRSRIPSGFDHMVSY